jgi:hypothetical protein
MKPPATLVLVIVCALSAFACSVGILLLGKEPLFALLPFTILCLIALAGWGLWFVQAISKGIRNFKGKAQPSIFNPEDGDG